jgi:deazaflavin-dependent oxidoreductase (nitroreductase family)
MPEEPSATEERLEEVAEFEATLRRTPLTRAMRLLGRSKHFATVYRRIGPRIDPWLMHRSKGRIMTRLYGMPAMLLTTTGARSGLARSSPLLYIRDGDDFVVVGTNFGQLQHPAWTTNLLAQPDAEIEVGPVRLAVRAELADQAAWDRLWPELCAVYPGYAGYLERCGDRVPRLFLLDPHPLEG